MTNATHSKSWDAVGYDRKFSFVAAYGEDVLQLLSPQPGERVLDLGCGTGELTAKIAALGAAVVGLDRDRDMIRRARALHPQLRFELADAHGFAPPASDQAFDAVFSNAALHWMLLPAAVIASVRRALRPGGRFVAEAGGRGNIAQVVRALQQARAEAGAPPASSPWFFPSIATYARLLEDGGFEPRQIHLYDRWTPLAVGESGMTDWINMFAGAFLEDLTDQQRDHVHERTIQLLRPALFADGRWSVDYRRLRFVAVRAA